jgi:threonine synthase
MSDQTTSPQQFLRCIACGSCFSWNQVLYQCSCGGLLELKHPGFAKTGLNKGILSQRKESFALADQSGVWRFREGVVSLPAKDMVIHPEGNTRLYARADLSGWADISELWFKHEGENPTGSFKDRGMTVAVSMARHLKKKFVACASTGNTSASLAAYAAHAKIRGVVFVPDGKISAGKLAQAVGYGALILPIQGDFDAAMGLVQKAASDLELYMVNSLNPFRIEGQKTIIWELLEQMQWQPPDWIFVPAGNLGNTSAFGKALHEAREWGWIDRLPRIASIQAEGASPFYHSFKQDFKNLTPMKAETVATAIQIGHPVNWTKARKVIQDTQGIVASVSDGEILEAKRMIDGTGVGCEPASAASLAGLKKMRQQGLVKKNERAVCILTGHILKDTETIMKQHAHPLSPIEPKLDAVARALGL